MQRTLLRIILVCLLWLPTITYAQDQVNAVDCALTGVDCVLTDSTTNTTSSVTTNNTNTPPPKSTNV